MNAFAKHCRFTQSPGSQFPESLLSVPYKDDLTELTLKMRSVLYSEAAIGRAFIAFHIPILIWLEKDLNRSRDLASYNNDNKVENCCEMDTVRLFSKWSCVGLNLHRLLSPEGTYGEGFSLSAGVWYNVGVSAIVCVLYTC